MSNTNWDIDRSAPRNLHIPLNKPETNLLAHDIEGAKPQCVKFKSTRQGNDPLNPNYNLQKVETKPITPPKFIRDTMHIDDIEGVRPKKRSHTKWATKESMKLDDIEGTKAKPRHKARENSQGYNANDYSDVTKT